MVSGGEFGAQYVELLDRRFGEQRAGLLAESCRNSAGQVSVTSGVIGEHVEDPERGRPEADREPRGGRLLVLNKRTAAVKELLHVVLLAGQLEDDTEEVTAHNEMWKMLNDYMMEHLNTDAKLVWEVTVTPPPFIKEKIKDGARVTNLILVDFFNMPRTRSSVRYFTELKDDIKFWLDKAKKELHY